MVTPVVQKCHGHDCIYTKNKECIADVFLQLGRGGGVETFRKINVSLLPCCDYGTVFFCFIVIIFILFFAGLSCSLF